MRLLVGNIAAPCVERPRIKNTGQYEVANIQYTILDTTHRIINPSCHPKLRHLGSQGLENLMCAQLKRAAELHCKPTTILNYEVRSKEARYEVASLKISLVSSSPVDHFT